MALRSGPFSVAEARSCGVSRGHLRGPSYHRLGAGLYRWAGLDENPDLLLRAVARRLPPGAAFSGWTAAWLHGLDVKPCEPIEVTIPDPLSGGHRAGTSVRRGTLAPAEIVIRRHVPATSALRTVADLGARDPLTEAVVAADLFLHARLVTVTHLHAYVADHPEIGRASCRERV